MINGAEILKRVQAGQGHEVWRIIYADRGFFKRNMIVYATLVLALIAFTIYFIPQDWAITFGAASLKRNLSDESVATWRTIDFVIIGLLLCLFSNAAYGSYVRYKNPQKDALILMPEGVVIRMGRSTSAIDFSATSSITIDRARNEEITLLVKDLPKGKKKKIFMDKRFGNAKILGELIIGGYQQFQATGVKL